MSAAQSRRNRNRRKSRPDGEATYDGVTDWAIYGRDGWLCQMPECRCPDGRPIDQAKTGNRPAALNNPWRASIDHIVPLAENGRDDAPNKRAAHQRCNEAAQEHWGRGRQRLSHTIGEAPVVAELLSPLLL